MFRSAPLPVIAEALAGRSQRRILTARANERLPDSCVTDSKPHLIVNPRLTDAFGLPFSQVDVDFAIPHLASDLPLYLDPFLLWINTEPEDAALHAQLLQFFEDVRALVTAADTDSAARLLSGIAELPAIGLGYGQNTKSGSALGPESIAGILGAFANIPQLREGKLRHIEELQLVVPKIAEDRISDITASILRGHLVQYTERRALEHGIPTRTFAVEGIYDPQRKLWVVHRNAALPYNPDTGAPIILAPLRLLRHLPFINYEDYYRSGYSQYVLGPQSVARRVGKDAVLRYNQQQYEAVQRYVAAKEAAAADAKPTPLFTPFTLATLRKRFVELRALPTGRADGADRRYEEIVAELLISLLYPSLSLAEARSRTVSGAHIRDLIFYNDGITPFLRDMRDRYESRQPVFELKNVQSLDTEHVNQLYRYLDAEFGRFGVLVTRNPTPPAVARNIVDLHSSKRAIILTIDDSDLELMLNLAEAGRDPTEALLKRYVAFTRALPN